MPVPEEYVGVSYRQMSPTLKIYTEGKATERRVSERPRQHMDYSPGPSNPFTDSDEEPTVITFEATDDVDVAGLLKTGAIVEQAAAAPAEAAPAAAAKPAAAPKAPAAAPAPAEGGGETTG